MRRLLLILVLLVFVGCEIPADTETLGFTVWMTDPERNQVIHFDPETNTLINTYEVDDPLLITDGPYIGLNRNPQLLGPDWSYVGHDSLNYPAALEAKGDLLYWGEHRALSTFNPVTGERVSFPDITGHLGYIRDIAVLEDTVYILGPAMGYYYLQAWTLEGYQRDLFDTSYPLDDQANSITCLGDQLLMVLPFHNAIYTADLDTFAYHPGMDHPTNIEVAPDSTVWVGGEYGLYVFDQYGSFITVYNIYATGLAERVIDFCFEKD